MDDWCILRNTDMLFCLPDALRVSSHAGPFGCSFLFIFSYQRDSSTVCLLREDEFKPSSRGARRNFRRREKNFAKDLQGLHYVYPSNALVKAIHISASLRYIVGPYTAI